MMCSTVNWSLNWNKHAIEHQQDIKLPEISRAVSNNVITNRTAQGLKYGASFIRETWRK